jgi:hypothetical protein
MSRSSVCGDKPIAVPNAIAVRTPNNGTPTKVTIFWNKSLDQDAGEKDVERYMVFKKLAVSADWGNPIADLAASQDVYSLDDTTLPGGDWVYAVVAQDCSPSNSAATSTGTVHVDP